MKDTFILAIESSCDETAASVVKNGRTILSNVISSQIALHTLYGGVVPEIASRKHIEKINQVIEEALSEANVTLDDLDAIGVTYGPGLVGALLVGVAEAKAIAYAKKLPLVGVHHIEGHVSANYIEHPDLEPPFLCLIVSGGHTHLVIVKDYGEFEILGRTRDDAAGEAFDKVARAIGLGYPGGPKIDKLSKEGNPDAIQFPRAKVGDCPYDFSFSGVKSAVLNYLNQAQMKGEEVNRADLAASFQKAVVDVLVEHTMMAAKDYGMDKVAIAGGVASNGTLRAAMEKACEENGYQFFRPSPIFCTDNAAMIVVLPDQGVTIRELLSSEQYTREMFGRIDELESYGGIYWKIPKFQTAATADLGPSLAGLGLTDAFDVSRADFTGITGESLSLSGVIQSTVFSVNENGVGPFSENGEAGFAGLYSGETALQMNLDRPFLYAVTGYMGAPLYIGVCNRPAVNNP